MVGTAYAGHMCVLQDEHPISPRAWNDHGHSVRLCSRGDGAWYDDRRHEAFHESEQRRCMSQNTASLSRHSACRFF